MIIMDWFPLSGGYIGNVMGIMSHNSDLRDSREYIQKQVRGERIYTTFSQKKNLADRSL